MDLIKYRKWWYIISLVIIIPGSISLGVWGLKPSIDFTGGTQIEFSGTTDKPRLEEIAKNDQIENFTVTKSGEGLIFRTKSVDVEKEKKLKADVESQISGAKEIRIDTVGPSISKEITRNAFIMTALASLVIVFYIAIMFRKVPKPANSWEFGTAAVVALLHDALVVLGIFSLLGHFFNIEIDPLFITAILTVIGFSVHDTIVIFDRIRENLVHSSFPDFETTVSVSVFEMLPRTINTSFLVWVILLILYFFGGESTKYFVLALLIGVLSGTYSSILNASPLLVSWENFKAKRKRATVS
jgi:preprotein translocase subunit SecF